MRECSIAEGSLGRAIVLALALCFSSGLAQASLVIYTNPTRSISCSAGVCTATAQNAVLNATDLTNMLAAGDVKISTGAGVLGGKVSDIVVTQGFSWVSGHALTLDAFRSVVVSRQVTVAGQGGLTVITNDGGTGGVFSFGPKGKIAFWDLSSALTINGAAYALVGSIQQLAADIATNDVGNYALARDYDARGDGLYGAAPVSNTFGGTLEGLGNAILHLAIRAKACDSCDYGLFARLGPTPEDQTAVAVVRNLEIESANFVVLAGPRNSNIGSVGVLAGSADFAKISGVHVSGKMSINSGISGSGPVGGLVGSIGGTEISNASSSVSVGVSVPNNYLYGSGGGAGGLIGTSSEHSNINNSFATGPVVVANATKGGAAAGGFIGSNSETTISNSYALGSPISAAALLNGGGTAGGFAGTNDNIGSPHDSDPTIINCYAGQQAIGAVQKGTSWNAAAGGFVGLQWVSNVGSPTPIQNSYSLGVPSGVAEDGDERFGGFIGDVAPEQPGSASGGYWDTDTSGTAQGIGCVEDNQGDCGGGSFAGVVALTTAQFQSQLPPGFDPAIWGQNPGINSGLPYLLSNPPR
jgi:hypothetical protein